MLSFARRIAGVQQMRLPLQGMQLEDAEALVKSKRSQAHPYIDCWKVGAPAVQGQN